MATVTIGNFVKDYIESPSGLELGFGEGAKVTGFEKNWPDIPESVEARYAFRATSPTSNAIDVIAGRAKEKIKWDPAIKDFLERGYVTSPLRFGGGPGTPGVVNQSVNPVDRSYWSLGNVDPVYLGGSPGNVIVMDTEKAAYLQNRIPGERGSGFERWRLQNPQYTTFQPNFPDNATNLDRAIFAANPMNRTGLAIVPQVEVPQIPYAGEFKEAWVSAAAPIGNKHNISEELTDILTVDPLESGPIRIAGGNQYGEGVSVPRDRAAAVRSRGISFGQPTYDRITPFFERPWETHMANLRTEANIARSTIPTLGRAIGESSAATARAIGPARAMGAAGILGDVVMERAENMQRYPDPISGWMNAAGKAAMNLVDPTYYMGGVVGLGELAGLGGEARRGPTVLRGNIAVANAEYDRIAAREAAGNSDPKKILYPYGVNPDSPSMKKW